MRQKKLLISALTLVFAVIAVVSTTYAWFTMNSVNTVEELDFTATAGEGLYMTLDNTDEGSWTTELSKQDFAKLYSGDVDQELPGLDFFHSDFKLSPVTLLDANKTNKKLVTNKNVEATTGYVQFTIYFRSPVDMNVYISALNVYSKSEDVATPVNQEILVNGLVTTSSAWDQGKTNGAVTEVGSSTKLSTNLANAARVIVEGTNTQYIDPQLDNGFGGIASTYETSSSHQYISHVSSSTADAIVDSFGNDMSVVYGDQADEYKAFDPSTAIVDLSADGDYFTGQVTITLWIEGFDNDCFDVLLGDTLYFDVKFNAQA